jgi:hypothetical protein
MITNERTSEHIINQADFHLPVAKQVNLEFSMANSVFADYILRSIK